MPSITCVGIDIHRLEDKGIPSTEGRHWKRKLLDNVDYLKDEIEIRELVDHFVREEKITAEHKNSILNWHPRRKRVQRFFSVIEEEFDDSTYIDLKNQIDKQHGDILRHVDRHGRGRGCNTSQMIAVLWKKMINNILGDVCRLTSHLYAKRHISIGQVHNIGETKSHRQQLIQLLIRVEKKGLKCLEELNNGIKQIERLSCLAEEIDKQITMYDMAENDPDETTYLEMKAWQKAHLLMSYKYFKYAPCLEDIVDDLVESHVIKLRDIQTIENQSNYGWLVRHVLETNKEICYINLMKIIGQHTTPQIRSKLAHIEVECEKDPDILSTIDNIGNKSEKEEGIGRRRIPLYIIAAAIMAFVGILMLSPYSGPAINVLVILCFIGMYFGLWKYTMTQNDHAENNHEHCKLTTDVQITLKSIMSPTDGIISLIKLEGTEDSQFKLISIILTKFGHFTGVSEGSLILHMQFDSLIKLTEFWLACLNGTLQKDLLDVFLTADIKERLDTSTLSLDMAFSLNDYVTAAYNLTLGTVTDLDNEENEKSELRRREVYNESTTTWSPSMISDDSIEDNQTHMYDKLTHEAPCTSDTQQGISPSENMTGTDNTTEVFPEESVIGDILKEKHTREPERMLSRVYFSQSRVMILCKSNKKIRGVVALLRHLTLQQGLAGQRAIFRYMYLVPASNISNGIEPVGMAITPYRNVPDEEHQGEVDSRRPLFLLDGYYKIDNNSGMVALLRHLTLQEGLAGHQAILGTCICCRPVT